MIRKDGDERCSSQSLHTRTTPSSVCVCVCVCVCVMVSSKNRDDNNSFSGTFF